MVASRRRLSPIVYFNILGSIGFFIAFLVGGLVRTLTGWSPWIAFGIPMVVLILITLAFAPALNRAVRRYQREQQQGGVDPH